MTKIRIGMGFDTHQLKEGIPFWLGGVNIPSDKGAIGHSDADVLIHAICDALLGTVGMGDIGTHFSDQDARWKGMKSVFFLKKIVAMLHQEKWYIENVDSTICLEKPKLMPYVSTMKKILAPLMYLEEKEVSIKATTNERLGYVGREEGVSAYAVVLVQQREKKNNVEKK